MLLMPLLFPSDLRQSGKGFKHVPPKEYLDFSCRLCVAYKMLVPTGKSVFETFNGGCLVYLHEINVPLW
jgi:hypothetical protein